VAADLLVRANDCLYIAAGGEWCAIRGWQSAVGLLDQAVTVAYAAAFPDLRSIVVRRDNARENQHPIEILAEQGEAAPFTVSRTVPRSYGDYLIGATSFPKAAVPDLDGFLNHPIAGVPNGVWRERRPWRCPTGSPGADSPHLRALFSGLPLDPAGHAALHMYLFGAFHAVSLENEKPLLFVDSWVRGRGKSEVCDAIQILLEGSRCAIEASPARQAFHDSLIAHLVSGARVVPLHNLEGRPDYMNETFASIATDGGLSTRPKYGRESLRFPGVLPILNGVYGAFSLHKDLLCRCWRVELPGVAQALTLRPREYAEAHRDEIIAEILQAHKRATIQGARSPVTRFAEFERCAGRAYRQAFALGEGETWDRIKKMQCGATALLQSGVRALYSAHPRAFEAPHDKVVGGRFDTGPKEVPHTGATALGFTFNGDTWDGGEDEDEKEEPL
jgi:hypothetical protein